MEKMYWISIFAVVVSSISGSLKAGKTNFDLFGVIIIATVTGLGGGSVRDVLLGTTVFWIEDEIFLITTIFTAIIVFFSAKSIQISTKYFLIADAASLATFSVSGTLVALEFNSSVLIASFMGVITGVLGGIFRDTLCNEHPVVFLGKLYATIAWLGSLLLIALLHFNIGVTIAAISAGLFIFSFRLLAIYFDLNLPKFESQ